MTKLFPQIIESISIVISDRIAPYHPTSFSLSHHLFYLGELFSLTNFFRHTYVEGTLRFHSIFRDPRPHKGLLLFASALRVDSLSLHLRTPPEEWIIFRYHVQGDTSPNMEERIDSRQRKCLRSPTTNGPLSPINNSFYSFPLVLPPSPFAYRPSPCHSRKNICLGSLAHKKKKAFIQMFIEIFNSLLSWQVIKYDQRSMHCEARYIFRKTVKSIYISRGCIVHVLLLPATSACD